MTTTPTADATWFICGATHVGESHLADAKPNQDSVLTSVPSDSPVALDGLNQPASSRRVYGTSRTPVILAASDGHGDELAFRSDRGSRFAVEVVMAVFREFEERHRGQTDLRAAARDAHERLPVLLKSRWNKAVEADIAAHAFQDDAQHYLATEPGKIAKVVHDPYLMYGATCGAVLVTDQYLLYLMLGDPDIVAFHDDGSHSVPLKKLAETGAGTVTESLCEADAVTSTMIALQPLVGSPPVLVTLSSDGVANSFANDSGFTAWLGQRLRDMRQQTHESVATDLPGLLQRLSRDGSGDDMSLVMVKRVERYDGQQIVSSLHGLQQTVGQLVTTVQGLTQQIAALKTAGSADGGRDAVAATLTGLQTQLQTAVKAVDERLNRHSQRLNALDGKAAPAKPAGNGSSTGPVTRAMIWIGVVLSVFASGASIFAVTRLPKPVDGPAARPPAKATAAPPRSDAAVEPKVEAAPWSTGGADKTAKPPTSKPIQK